jgi:hypothetical protein
MKYCRKSPPASDFTVKGFREQEYFRHRALAIQKQYPDTFLLLEARGIPPTELLAGNFFQINLYSGQLPIAGTGLYLHEDSLTITLMQPHLEERFSHWYRMLFNAIFDFAIECGVSSVRCPTAASILAFPTKSMGPDLVKQIYDSPNRNYICRRTGQGRAEYWEARLSENADRVVKLVHDAAPDPGTTARSICIFHDIEENVDTDISPQECHKNLAAMLEIEKKLGIRTSYNILGALFPPKRDEIWASDPGHSLAFHSFNHDFGDESQLTRCREVDLQVRGYRPPRSILTAELTDYRLSYLNFEWLACGKASLGKSSCFLQNGIVKIPISTDDYPLATAQTNYETWEHELLERARSSAFFAFGLHDCYSPAWLDFYPKLLEKLSAIGTLVTADQVCDRVFWLDGTELPALSSWK